MFLASDFLTKVAQINSNFQGYFEKYHHLIKLLRLPFWATFGKNWLLFIRTSGHTVCIMHFSPALNYDHIQMQFVIQYHKTSPKPSNFPSFSIEDIDNIDRKIRFLR